MLTKSERTFSIFFIIILIAELICGSIESLTNLRYITKPAIVISLIVFFWNYGQSVSKPIRNLTLLALVFSLFGDVFLMFVDRSPNYFIFGLIAFLIAQVMYITAFLQQRNPSFKSFWIIGVLDVYAIGLFLFLKEYLGDMLIPVLIYIVVILVMASSAFLRKGSVSKASYKLVAFGAILFLVSDSILSLDKFYHQLPLANVLIMTTYAFAQYFIVMGIKKAP